MKRFVRIFMCCLLGIWIVVHVPREGLADSMDLKKETETLDPGSKDLSLEELDSRYKKLQEELRRRYEKLRQRKLKEQGEGMGLAESAPSSEATSDGLEQPSLESPVTTENGDEKKLILNEVVVTATREKEALKDISGEIGIIKKDKIENTTANSLHEVLKFMPGVTVQQRFGTDDVNLSIRGSGIRQSFGVRGIQVLVDGIPLTEPDGQTRLDLVDLAAVERIEVVKGPASTIYGGNASGGVINIITKKGKPNSGVNGEARYWGGSFDYHKGFASVYGGEDNYQYFAGFSHSQRDGFRDHAETDGQRFNANFSWQPNDKSELNLFLAAGSVNILIPGSLTLSQMQANPRQANATAVARNANRFDDRFRLGIQFRREFSQYLEGAVVGYWDYRQMEHIPVFQFIELSRIATGEDVRLTYTRPVFGFANKLIVGSSFQFQFSRENDYAVLNGGRGNLVADEDQDQSHFGVYAQDQFFVSDNVSITSGVRYSRFEFKLEDHFFSDGNQGGQIDFDKFTYQVGGSWTPIPEANLFANFSTAFQTPTLQEITSGPTGGFIGLKPENVANYEVGVRGNFVLLGMPAAYEATYFRMEFEDKILPRTVGFNTTFVNAGDTLHEGVSAGLSLDVTRALNVQVSYTYSDFRFTAGQFDGNKVPGQTPHQLLSALYYTFFLPKSATLTLGAEHRYSDDYFVNDNNTFTNPNWQTLTLKADYRQGRFGAQVVVDNVTDEVYSDAVTINDNLGRFFNPADGFSVIGSVSWRY